MDARHALDLRAYSLMLLLCMLWGLQQIFLKATADDVPPMLMIGLRSGVAALLVGATMAWRRQRIDWQSGHWRPGLVVGALFALEYLLVGEGLRHTHAAHMAVFLYTAPIFAALGLHWKLPNERLTPLQWGGIALAFVGIGVAFFDRANASVSLNTNAVLWGDFLGLLGGAAWGATTVMIRVSSLSRAAPSETLLYQLVGAFVLLLLSATLLGQLRFNPTPAALSNLAFQAVVISFASFLAWFWLLRHYLASRLGVLSFLTPLFGVVFGAMLLKEPLTTSFLLGSALVLAGVVLVSGHSLVAQAWSALRSN